MWLNLLNYFTTLSTNLAHALITLVYLCNHMLFAMFCIHFCIHFFDDLAVLGLIFENFDKKMLYDNFLIA